MPGIRPNSPTMPAAMAKAFGKIASCEMICWPTSAPVDTRLTMMPAADEMTSAGICATSPSPMVSSV